MLENNTPVIEIAVEQMALHQRLKNFEQLTERLKAAKKTLKEEREAYVDYDDYLQASNKAKHIRKYIDGEPQVQQAKEKVTELKEQRDLLGEVIVEEMQERQLSLFESPLLEGRFTVKQKLKYEKKTAAE